jgi:hypothetical protein
MVVADDNVREWGKQNWEEKSADYEAKGYIPVSMRNDFAQIYEEGIVPAEEQYQEPVLPAADDTETAPVDTENEIDDSEEELQPAA